MTVEKQCRCPHTWQVGGVLAVRAGGGGATDCAGALGEAVGVTDIVGHRVLLHLLIGQEAVWGRVGRVLTVSGHQHRGQHCNRHSASSYSDVISSHSAGKSA